MGIYLMRMCAVILLNHVFILGNCLLSQHATAYWKESPELDREHWLLKYSWKAQDLKKKTLIYNILDET